MSVTSPASTVEPGLQTSSLHPCASDPLTVLDITEWFGDTTGGIRTYLLQKSLYAQQREQLRHVLVVPGAGNSIETRSNAKTYRLRGPRIPRQPPYRLMLSRSKVMSVVGQERPDIIEVGSPFLSAWLARAAAHRFDVPLVAYFHSNAARLLAPRGARSSLLRRALHDATWSYLRVLHSRFAVTIASSHYAVRELASAGIQRVVRVPLGVDVALFNTTRRAHSDATRAQHSLPTGLLATFVGRFAAEKELLVVLDAWERVEKATGARLLLVGAGPAERELRRHPYAHRVTFLPFQADRARIADLLAACDLYIAPGRIETFGLSSLEALASGTPLLAANEGGVAEQVELSKAGLTFVAGNANSLAENAAAILRDPERLRAMGEAGRQYAVSEHDWTHVMDRLFDVYRAVVDEYRGR